MKDINLGPGGFPDAAWYQGELYVIAQVNDAMQIVVFSGDLRVRAILPFVTGVPGGYPKIGAWQGELYATWREGREPYRAVLWSLGGTVIPATTGPVSGENPVALGAGFLAWRQRTTRGYETYARALDGSAPELWAIDDSAEGLNRIIGLRQLEFAKRANRTQPWSGGWEHRSGALLVAEDASGGVIGKIDGRDGWLSLWFGAETFRPRCAYDGVNRWAVVTTGREGVRVAIASPADLVPDRPTSTHMPPPTPVWQPLPGPVEMLDYAIGARPDAWPKGGLDLQVDRHRRRAVWMKGGKAAYEAWDDRFYYLYEDHSDETPYGYGLTPGILYPRTFRPGEIVQVMAPAFRLDFNANRSFTPRPWWYHISAEWTSQYAVPGYGPLDLVRVKRTPVNGDGSPQRPNGHEYDWCSKEWGRVAFEDGRGNVTVFPAPTPDAPRATPPPAILTFPPLTIGDDPVKAPKVNIEAFNDRQIRIADPNNGTTITIDLQAVPNEPHARDVHVAIANAAGSDRSALPRIVRF